MGKNARQSGPRAPAVLTDEQLAAAAGASTAGLGSRGGAAAGRTPGHTPEWSNPNDGDPGLAGYDPDARLKSSGG